MNRLRVTLEKLPCWLPSIVVLGIILWLTLVPRPFGDDAPSFFEGEDKVAHGLMFFVLTLALLFDKRHSTGGRALSRGYVLLASAMAMLLGLAIEFAQEAMGMGRTFDICDVIADVIGVMLGAIVWVVAAGCGETHPEDAED